MFSFAGIVLIGGNNTPEPSVTLSATIEVIGRVVVASRANFDIRSTVPVIHVTNDRELIFLNVSRDASVQTTYRRLFIGVDPRNWTKSVRSPGSEHSPDSIAVIYVISQTA